MNHYIAAACFVLVNACTTISMEDSFQSKGIELAAVELSCPKEQLVAQVLQRAAHCAGSRMSVSGCSKKVVYICLFSGEWTQVREFWPGS